jgi:hypothetical protein
MDKWQGWRQGLFLSVREEKGCRLVLYATNAFSISATESANEDAISIGAAPMVVATLLAILLVSTAKASWAVTLGIFLPMATGMATVVTSACSRSTSKAAGGASEVVIVAAIVVCFVWLLGVFCF